MTIATMKVLQAWIAPHSDDPEAASALAIARTMEPRLEGLRRCRLVEIRGSRRSQAAAAALLHGSTQFYNPHKERCSMRSRATEAIPAAAEGECVIVWERGGERRSAAERWWSHETGETVEVSEATVWWVSASPASAAGAVAEAITGLRDARHGLLCNPWSQQYRRVVAGDPLPWMGPDWVRGTAGDL